MNPWYIIGLAVGSGLIIYGLTKENSSVSHPKINPMEAIKADLISMNVIEKEIATKKALTPCSKEIAMQIYDDFISCFGTDIITYILDLAKEIIANRDIDALIKFFDRVSGIMDSNKYGLKAEIENSAIYKTSRLDLAQQRLKLKKDKKHSITQKNIDRTRTLSYGLNSSILLRGTVDALPNAQKIMPAIIKTTLESIESEAEKTLNTMVNDLDSEWKVKVDIKGLL